MPLLKGEELSSKSTQTKSPARTSLLLHLVHYFIAPLPQLSFFVIVFLNSFSFLSLIFKGLWQREKRFLPSFPTPTPLSRRSINIQQGPEVQTAERLGENRATPIHNGFSSLFHLLSVGRCCRGTTGTKWEMQRRGGEGEERGWELERERERHIDGEKQRRPDGDSKRCRWQERLTFFSFVCRGLSYALKCEAKLVAEGDRN